MITHLHAAHVMQIQAVTVDGRTGRGTLVVSSRRSEPTEASTAATNARMCASPGEWETPTSEEQTKQNFAEKERGGKPPNASVMEENMG
jgi:hypothetical protein